VIDLDGRLYSYGFAVTSQSVVEEWLFVREPGKKKDLICFERTTADSGEVKVRFGKSLLPRGQEAKQFLRFVATGTRPNRLFLTEAVDRNVEELRPLAVWFDSLEPVLSGDNNPLRYNSNYRFQLLAHDDKDFAGFLRDLLHATGSDIDAVTTEETPRHRETLAGLPPDPGDRPSIFFKADTITGFGSDPSGIVLYFGDGSTMRVVDRTEHRTSEGGTVSFDIGDESGGTLRLMQLAPILFAMRRRKTVVLMGELERSLHPLLSKMFLQTALSDEIRASSQLIFSTHDTDLLDADIMRRDEIWFVEKGAEGASHLRSLAEFDIRPDLKIGKGYLIGRFGAIPLIEDLPKAKAKIPSAILR
jgi:hypothetical protein